MNVGSSTSYRRGEGETTEWEDILRAKGITGPSEAEEKAAAAAAVAAATEEAADAAAAAVAADPLRGRTLAEVEEEGDDDVSRRAIEEYRAKRLAEVRAAAARNRFGSVLPLGREDFVREVTEGSKEAWVVLLLFKEGIPESKLLESLWPRVRCLSGCCYICAHTHAPIPSPHPRMLQIAAKHKATKFMQIVADRCIEGYPDRNVPTILVYHNGGLVREIVRLASLDGLRCTLDVLEWVLAAVGAVTTELEDDPRSSARGGGGGGGGGSGSGISGRAGGTTLYFGRDGGGRRRRDEDDDDDD